MYSIYNIVRMLSRMLRMRVLSLPRRLGLGPHTHAAHLHVQRGGPMDLEAAHQSQ